MGDEKSETLRCRKKSPIFIMQYQILFRPFFLCLLLLLAGCYEPKEGCLDINAVNFSVKADRPCSSCCTYPTLRMAIAHKLTPNQETNLNFGDSIYTDGAGNRFRLRNIQFLISRVRLVRPDGTEVYPTDTVRVRLQQPNGIIADTVLANNFVLANRNIFTAAEIGTFATEGKFEKLRFTLGIRDVANRIVPTSLPDPHPLRTEGMYANAETGYIFNRLEWFNHPTDTIVTRLLITGESNAREVEVPVNANVLPGFHVRVLLRVNYLLWFADVNLKNDLPAVLTTKFVNNAANSFSVTNVFLENQ